MKYFKISFIIKNYLPKLAKLLINIRDNNKFIKNIKSAFVFPINKKIHGIKIVSKSKGFLIDCISNNFVSFTLRPKKSEDVNRKAEVYSNTNTGIIIQGPMYGLEDFVSNTIKIYKNIFPKTKIFLSTWEDEINQSFIKKFNKTINIIINKKPKNNKHNLDLQIISTASAIKKIKKKKLKFILKTRTDCRIYKPHSIELMKKMLEIFKSKKKKLSKNRIISCSIDTRKYRVYGLSDILLFGTTADIDLYFKNAPFEKELKKLKFGNYPLIIKKTAVINEIFLCSRYLKNLGYKLKWSLDDWWKKCSDHFIVIDGSLIDFFWYKYHWKYEQRFHTSYVDSHDYSMTFSDWLLLYNNSNHKFSKRFQESWFIKNGQIIGK